MSGPQLNPVRLFTLRLDLDGADIQGIGAVPGGQRTNVPVSGGSFEGPRLRRQVLPGAYSVPRRDDGVTPIDVRPADGRRPDSTPTVGLDRFRRREPVPDDGLSIRTTPHFETDDERYWLNTVVAVSKGSRDAVGAVLPRLRGPLSA